MIAKYKWHLLALAAIGLGVWYYFKKVKPAKADEPGTEELEQIDAGVLAEAALEEAMGSSSN